MRSFVLAAAVLLSFPAAAQPPKKAAAQVVELTVTDDGFVPAQVKVKAGQPIKLRVTRKTDATCAREIVIKADGVNQALPLGKTVDIDLKAHSRGNVRFACAMDMVAGSLVVE